MIAAALAAAVALSVSPTHLELPAGASARVHVRSDGGRLLLRASLAGLALDGRGRPQVVPLRDRATGLTVHPRTVAVARGGATVVIASRRLPHARPGDHSAIVLLTAVTPTRSGVAVGLRVGLVVTVRAGGRVKRRIVIVAARTGHRLIALRVANRGDVIESIGGARLEVTLLRRGRVLARLRASPRKLLPRTSTVVGVRCRAGLRGRVVARIELRGPGLVPARRTFHLRL